MCDERLSPLFSRQGRLSLSLALPLARRGPSHIAHTPAPTRAPHAPQTPQSALTVQSSTSLFVLSFRSRIPTNKYKGLKKRDLYVSADDNHRYIVHSVVCVCAMCFSLACQRQRRRQARPFACSISLHDGSQGILRRLYVERTLLVCPQEPRMCRRLRVQHVQAPRNLVVRFAVDELLDVSRI